MSAAPIRVRLLTSEGCRYCGDARALLERLAREHPLEMDELGLETEEGRALALAHGVLFPPGIFIEGEFVQYGRPSQKKVRARLDAIRTARAAGAA